MAAPPSVMTPQQYLESERVALEKSEFINGQLVAMSGVLRSHARIAMNLGALLHSALRGTKCEGFTSDLRVAAPKKQNYFYPDLSVACESEFEDERQDTLINPLVIFEILSKSTESYDRGPKFSKYRQIASLRQYVLVSQSSQTIESYSREGNGLWVLQDVEGPDSQLELKALGITIPLREIYERVEFISENSN